jgi:hypothetical protein
VGYAGLAELFLRADENLAEAKATTATAVCLEATAWHYFILAAICEKVRTDAVVLLKSR